MKSLKSVAVALACAALGTVASAQTPAYTSKDAHLRAGPARDYPVVAILQSGVSIMVQGCLGDYTWCDVTVGPDRGWVYAKNIVYPYEGANQPVMAIGAMIGIGILAFSLNDYWDHYYLTRPWYPQRQRWVHRPPPPPHAFGPGGPRPVPMPGAVPFPRPQPQPPGAGRPHLQQPGAGQNRPPMGAPPPGATQPRPPHVQAPGGGQRPAQGQPSGAVQPHRQQGGGQRPEQDRRGGQGH